MEIFTLCQRLESENLTMLKEYQLRLGVRVFFKPLFRVSFDCGE